MDLSQYPAILPPDGLKSNFVNPESNAYIARNITCAFLPLMIIFLGLRIYSRIHVGFKFGADDFLSVAAAANIIAFCGILLTLLDKPYGHHLYDVRITDITDDFLKRNLVFLVLYSTSILLVKATLLVLYLRIFRPVYTVNMAIYVCIGVITVFYVATAIAYLVECVPRQGESDGGWLMTQALCGATALDIAVVQGVFGPISDLCILLIPMSLVLPLGLPRRQKIAVACIFLTGGLAIVCSVIVCVTRFRERGSPDFTWENTLPDAFAVIELTVGLICACLPTMPPLIALFGKNERLRSLVRYLRSRRSTNKPNSSDTEFPPSSHGEKDGLPEIPQGRLTGLRSFFRVGTASRQTGVSTNGASTLNSVDIDYHAQLRNGASV